MINQIPILTFHTGRKIPQIGYGTYLLKGSQCLESVKIAIKNGYRLIDSGSIYQNAK